MAFLFYYCFRTQILGPALLLKSCVILGKLPNSRSLNFPNVVLQGCCEDSQPA